MSKKSQAAGYGVIVISFIVIVSSAMAANFLLGQTVDVKEELHDVAYKAEGKFSSYLTLVQATATDGSDKTLEEFEFTLKLGAGSEGLLFEDLYIIFTSENTRETYVYNSSINCTNKDTTIPLGGYGIYFAYMPDNHPSDYVKKGDLIRLCFESPNPVPDFTIFSVNFVLKQGVKSSFERRTPRSITHSREMLYPY